MFLSIPGFGTESLLALELLALTALDFPPSTRNSPCMLASPDWHGVRASVWQAVWGAVGWLRLAGEAISQSSWILGTPRGEAEAAAAPDKVTDGLRFALETVVSRGDKEEEAASVPLASCALVSVPEQSWQSRQSCSTEHTDAHNSFVCLFVFLAAFTVLFRKREVCFDSKGLFWFWRHLALLWQCLEFSTLPFFHLALSSSSLFSRTPCWKSIRHGPPGGWLWVEEEHRQHPGGVWVPGGARIVSRSRWACSFISVVTF